MKENWEIHWKDYYKILQIHPLAEPEVVKVAYNKLAQKYHPDTNKDSTASVRMKDLNEAFEIISNPQKRTLYDTQYNKLHVNPINSSAKSEIKTDTTYTGTLTLDEKLNLLFIMLSNDKSIKFRKKEWIKKIDQVKEALKLKGTASKLGECPYCRLKSVLANSDASAGWCINPKCDYIIGYIKPFQPSKKYWY